MPPTPSRGGVRGQTIDASVVAQASGANSPLLYAPNGQEIWFGPGAPIAPVAPEGTPERSWDYPVFWNTYINADAGKAQETGGITMAQLRVLANQTHVRAIIETVKDKQTKKEWTFAVKPKPGEKAAEADRRTAKDPRIAELTDFFETPDGEHEFAEWLRMLMEDMLTIDAGVVVMWPRIDGLPFRLEVYDGGTIVPKIDAGGRRPMGVDANGQPVVAFQQFIKGVPFEDFSDDELLYLKRNPRSNHVYGFSPVEQLAFYINIALRKDLTRLSHFTEGNVPAGLLPMPQGWSSQQIETWFKSFNTFVAGLPHNLVKMLPIPGGGGNPVFPGVEAFKAGETWEEIWIRLCCFVFGVSPSSLVHQMNRATADTAHSQAEDEGEQVYSDWVRRTLNRIIRKWFGYTDIVARAKEQPETDPEKQSKIWDVAVRNGTLSVDEVREAQGLDAIGVPNGIISVNGFTPFAAAMEQADATTERMRNPPPPPPQFGGQPPHGGKPDGEEPPPEKPAAKLQKKNPYGVSRSVNPTSSTSRNQSSPD